MSRHCKVLQGKGENNWFLENVQGCKEKNILYLHFTMDDNLSLSEKIKTRYRSMYTGVFYKRYILGLWAVAEGIIYDMFSEDEHIVKYDEIKGKLINNPSCRYVSCDYGTQNATIEQNELFAVYYYAKRDDSDRTDIKYIATVVTEHYKYILNIQNIDGIQPTYEQAEPHYKGEVPIIEYLNNKMGLGDFELQIPLIDAYNALMSDRVTDKEQFVDAILAIYGTLLSDGDEYDEEGNKISDSADEAQEELKKKKILELPDGTKAEYLTRTFDENGVEILKKAIEQDIHKFSHIPCMSDESFGGNVSGVAMEFKLLGMENITKIKTRYYKKGLRKRLRIFANFYANKGISFDVAGIVPTFTRALPKNLLEISQIVSNLWGKVGKKTLLAQIPFVDDPEEELKTVEKEAEDDLKRQQEMFSMTANTPPDDTSDSDSDSDSDEPDSSQDDKKDPKKKDGKVNE